MYIITKLWLVGFFLFTLFTLCIVNWDTRNQFDWMDALLLGFTGFSIIFQLFQLKGSLTYQRLFWGK